MDALQDAVLDVVQQSRFSGAIRIDHGAETVLCLAAGMADRAHGIANTIDTRFAVASGTKSLTAMVVVSLVADGTLTFDTTARSLLGADLPLVDDRVTLEQLLAHRSGIGDYFDESTMGQITDYLFTVPVHLLDATERYLAVLDGYPQRSAPGERFAYNNGAYVLLALLAERATGRGFADLLQTRVCRPAGLTATGLMRSDELPGGVARGYLAEDGLRTNVLHMPVLGGGDGGVYSTLGDVHRLWAAFLAGAVVPEDLVADMVRPHSTDTGSAHRYGLGFWLGAAAQDGASSLQPAPIEPDPIESAPIEMEGYDAGISFRSIHHPQRDVTWTVVANTSEGAWPVARRIAELIDAGSIG